MNFTVNRKQLSEAVSSILKAVSTKTTIPALEGLLLTTDEDKLYITAYDLELGMKTFLDADIKEDGKTVISARLFSEIVRRTTAENVTVNIDDKNIASIVCGESDFSIVCIDPEEFPELPSVNSDESIKIGGEILKSMIRQTIFAASDSDIKPVNKGSLFNFENGICELVSVDGYRLALRKEHINIDVNTSFIVPSKTLGEVLKLAGEGEVEIIPGRRHIMFKLENYIVVSSIIEGEFLDYKAALPKESTTTVKVKTKDFIDSTERVSLLISDKLKSPVRCKFSENEILLSSVTSIGRAKDKVSCEVEGEFLEMGFNNRFILDALRFTECDMVKFSISGAERPLVISPLEGDSFTFLVLPMRLKTEV